MDLAISPLTSGRWPAAAARRPARESRAIDPLRAACAGREAVPNRGTMADATKDSASAASATPPGQVAQEVRRSLTERSGDPVPEAAWRLLDDPVATRTVLADLLEQCWRLLIAPHWPRLRDLLQADVRYRTQMPGDYGLERVLADLHPRARWTGRAIVAAGLSRMNRTWFRIVR